MPQFFAFKPHMYIRRVAPDVKIYTWFSGSAYNLMYLFGPENLGGLGNLLPKIEEDVAKTGKPFDIVSVEVRICRANVILPSGVDRGYSDCRSISGGARETLYAFLDCRLCTTMSINRKS